MNILLYPPFAFIIALISIIAFGSLIKDFEPKIKRKDDSTKTYACGEDFPAQKINPGYEQLFPWAIFFTVLHITALILMTLAFTSGIPFMVPLIYIVIILIILTILFV